MADEELVRVRAEVQGIVQGVGFRPFVYQRALSLGLSGFVQNNSLGVEIEAEGSRTGIEALLRALREEAPPLARVTSVNARPIPPEGDAAFEIRLSRAGASRKALISPDVAVCADCLAEMNDPGDRRYRYPFINCTNCGPRYTIIRDIPYDRDKTTMAPFTMCPDCAAEYHNPADRRFHAQPNACPVCGPALALLDESGQPVEAADPAAEAVKLLQQGLIVAVKGLGGFHLAVDAVNGRAVRRLRERKRREEKPLAVMAPDPEAVRGFAMLTKDEEMVLCSIQRPIVLLEARQPSPLSPQVAPDNKYIGVMLPYAPLHYLLLPGFTALVMTSGNLSEEPIAKDNEEAVRRLSGIADYFLIHDRGIHLRADDSVVRVQGRSLRQVRRSRGYVPAPVFLRRELPPVLAVGGELKNTVCLTKEGRAFVSQHIGDLENTQTLDFFELTIRHLRQILQISPEAVACDLHPDYLSTRWALERSGLETMAVQHHHAHIASVLAEHHLAGPVIGLACDGTGYGDDGRIWGGEILLADARGYERLGHLAELPLPGGAAAIREPWRMAVSYLFQAFGRSAAGLDLELLHRREAGQVDLLMQVIGKGINSPLTSSLGRLFDAAAALVGLKDKAAFEGQAAMMLEMCCPGGEFPSYDFDLDEDRGRVIVNPAPLIRQMVRDLGRGKEKEEISGRFHATVIKALAAAVLKASARTGLKSAALSGGCFQNMILTAGLVRSLERAGLTVYTQNLVPANDGGLSLGQALCAAERLAS